MRESRLTERRALRLRCSDFRPSTCLGVKNAPGLLARIAGCRRLRRRLAPSGYELLRTAGLRLGLPPPKFQSRDDISSPPTHQDSPPPPPTPTPLFLRHPFSSTPRAALLLVIPPPSQPTPEYQERTAAPASRNHEWPYVSPLNSHDVANTASIAPMLLSSNRSRALVNMSPAQSVSSTW